MSDEENALVKQLLLAKRSYVVGGHTKHEWVNPDGPVAVNRIDAQATEIEKLRDALRKIEQGVPRPVGKSWRVDGRPSKYDECIHGIWMSETCEECTDAVISEALGETK